MENHKHFIVFKPFGYLSQFISNAERKKQKHRFLGSLYNFPANTMAIGRLDRDSEGLLLLTTNGKTSELVRSKKVEKEYYVLVDGTITLEAIEKLQKGVEISYKGIPYLTKPSKTFILSETPKLPERSKKIRDARHGPMTWIRICISEGKFRQVRKMTAAVGFPTLRLVRVRVGNIHIQQMKAGEVMEWNGLFK